MIEAVVKEKAEANQKYEDIIAKGDLAVLGERKSKGQEYMNLKIGNLLPGQEIKICAQIV